MLDIKYIRENPEKVKQGAKNKGVDIDIDRLLELDKERRELLKETESVQAQQNKISKGEISQDDRGKARELKDKIKQHSEKLETVVKEYGAIMAKIPNPAFDEVPVGKDDSENVVLRKWGKIPEFDFTPKEHWEIGEALDLIDTERGAKVAGPRFYYLKREAVLLEFALVNLALEMLAKKGFIPVLPPEMIKKDMAWAMGYLQQTDDEEAYHLEKDDLYLIATAEQTLGAMRADEVLDENVLPLRYVGFSSCFRREAGSYGKDTKGILRVHQFYKVEMFIFCKPEDSKKEHELLLACEEELMKALKLPYQVVDICTGDLGTPAAKKFDIEAWMPGQNKYRETHSTSNCTDFQARRLNIKYRNKQGGLNFVYTLNGTAFSMRPIIAILENYQKKDGSVEVPKALRKYVDFSVIRPIKK